MTLTTHTAIGAAIGSLVGNPILGFILGAASHFLVDMIPHGDMFISDNFRVHRHKQKHAVGYAFLDAAVGITLLVILGQLLPDSLTQSPTYRAAIFGSVLPDILVGLSDIWKNKLTASYAKFHFFFHDFFCRKYGDVKLPYSLVAQLTFVIGVAYWLSL